MSTRPWPESKATIAKIPGLGEIDLAPFGIKVPKPGFVIVTGDLNEFGGGSGAWAEYLSYWKACPVPVYHGLGNHDNTWHANLKFLRGLGLGPCYSFDKYGCHFVSLMTRHPPGPAAIRRRGRAYLAGEGPCQGRRRDAGVRVSSTIPCRGANSPAATITTGCWTCCTAITRCC